MAIVNDKSDLMTSIGAYTVLANKKPAASTINLFSSINSKSEPIPFFLDLLKVLQGSDAVKKNCGEMVTNISTTAEPQLKKSISNQVIQPNANQPLPSSFVSNGYNMNMKNIDVYGKYKTNPNSTAGSLLYNQQTPNFDTSMANAISAGGTNINHNNMILNYNSSTDSVNIKPQSSSMNIGNFLSSIVSGMHIIDTKEFTTNVLNAIFGTITTSQNKTINQATIEMSVNNLLLKSIANEPLVINQSELNDINTQAQNLINGTNIISLCCGVITSSLPITGFTNVVSQISGSTSGFAISNALQNGLNQSLNNSGQASLANQNNQNINDSYFTNIINTIVLELTKAATSTPQIKVLKGLLSGFQNNQPQFVDSVTDVKNNQTFINCMSKSSSAIINEFLFNEIKKALVDLIVPIGKQIAQEKINNYITILKSLVGF